MNKELMLKVADAIEAEPSMYDQSDWGPLLSYDEEEFTEKCETPCCIAGWAVKLAGWENLPNWHVEGGVMSARARVLLGLTREQAELLFDASGTYWPEPFASDFRAAICDQEKQAAVAAGLLRALAAEEVRLIAWEAPE